MARSKKRLVYLEPELDAAIVKRAADLGISVNEWLNQCANHYLASKGIEVTITETRTVRL
jgi:predicted HicB family RNase H-like nuclease